MEPLEPRRLLAAGTGLLATYFNNANFTGTTVTRVDKGVAFDWGGGSPSPKIAGDTFAVRWTGRVKAAFSERYVFDVVADDGVRLGVNHALLIDNWSHASASPSTRSGAILLSAGRRYDIQLEYRERRGDASVKLLWSSDSTPQQTVPRPRLYPKAQDLGLQIDHAFAIASEQLRGTLAGLDGNTATFPNVTHDGAWRLDDVHAWTAGFLGGALWQIADHEPRGGADTFWREQAITWSRAVAPARNDGDDLGTRFISTYAPMYASTHLESDRQVLLDAAMSKLATFDPTVGMFRSVHGRTSTSGDPHANFPVLIDHTMDLELVYQAAQLQNRSDWIDEANNHLAKLQNTLVHPDGSTYQWGYFDEADGKFISGETRQGLSDSSTWSRGQAWAIYSFVTAYGYTRRADFLATAKKTADYFLNHLPSDHVPYWDFDAPASSKPPRDSSAAAIAASALLRLAQLLGDTPSGHHYRAAGEQILSSLLSPHYLNDAAAGPGILLHGARYVAKKDRDNSLIYGDYFLLQAMNRDAALT